MQKNVISLYLRTMYLLELIFENIAYNGDGVFHFQKRKDSRTLAKWAHLGNDKAARQLLTLITIGLGGDRYQNAVGVPAMGEFVCMYGCNTTIEEDVERSAVLAWIRRKKSSDAADTFHGSGIERFHPGPVLEPPNPAGV